jgi:hypothetical protein
MAAYPRTAEIEETRSYFTNVPRANLRTTSRLLQLQPQTTPQSRRLESGHSAIGGDITNILEIEQMLRERFPAIDRTSASGEIRSFRVVSKVRILPRSWPRTTKRVWKVFAF